MDLSIVFVPYFRNGLSIYVAVSPSRQTIFASSCLGLPELVVVVGLQWSLFVVFVAVVVFVFAVVLCVQRGLQQAVGVQGGLFLVFLVVVTVDAEVSLEVD